MFSRIWQWHPDFSSYKFMHYSFLVSLHDLEQVDLSMYPAVAKVFAKDTK